MNLAAVYGYLFKIGLQVFPFVFTEDPQRQTDNGPQMDDAIAAAVMITEFMNLSVTVVTAGNAIIGTSGLDLVILQPTEFQALLFISGLQKTAASAATIIVGAVGLHIDKIFFPDDSFDHESKIFGDGVAIAFAYNLAWILDRKLDF
jgi:hypothetical protein